MLFKLAPRAFHFRLTNVSTSYEDSLFEALKSELVREMFVRTADENYVTSRWCGMAGLSYDFFWLAAHAIEKYFKAMLLSNEESTRNDSHRLLPLLLRVREIAKELLPTDFVKPPKLDIFWHSLNLDEFVERLSENGNSENRYGVNGYDFLTQDLHMLDQLVYATRRLVIPLDQNLAALGGRKLDCTNRRFLINSPGYFKLSDSLPLERLLCAKADHPARLAFLNLNWPFAPEDYIHPSSYRDARSWLISSIDRYIFDLLESDYVSQVNVGVRVADWLRKNVRLAKEHRDQIEAALKSSRQKNGSADPS